jgi:hypothetical protein
MKIAALRCVALAKRNTAFEGSSRVCLDDALYLLDQGDWGYAACRASRSLAHSVGMGHPDFVKADAFMACMRMGLETLEAVKTIHGEKI